MTNVYVSVQLQVNGQPYTFTVDSSQTASPGESMTNLVSGLTIGSTFSSGAVVSNVSGAIIEQAGTGGFSILGAVITDASNNVVMEIPLTSIEKNPPESYPVQCPVGLNYSMYVISSNSAV